MKKLLSFVAAAALCASTVGCSDTQTKNNESNMTNEKILFINGSPNKDGNTAALAATLLEGNAFEGKRLFFLYQGEAPMQMMLDNGEYSMKRFAAIYGFTYMGMATNQAEAARLRGVPKGNTIRTV